MSLGRARAPAQPPRISTACAPWSCAGRTPSSGLTTFHLEIPGQALGLALEAAAEHHERRDVVVARGVRDEPDPVALSASPASRRRPQRPDARSRSGRRPAPCGASSAGAAFTARGESRLRRLLRGRRLRRRLARGGLGLGEERAADHLEEDGSSTAATAATRSVAVQPGRTASSTRSSWIGWSTTRTRFARAAVTPSLSPRAWRRFPPRAARTRWSRSSRVAARVSSTLRCASHRGWPKEGGATTPTARSQSRCRSAIVVSMPVPTLNTPARPTAASRRAHDVVDVDEVARDRPVAVDRRRLACGEPLEEDRDHAALERRRLARAVDVREPQRDVARAEDPVPAFDVHLGRPFREPVRRHRSQGGLSRAGASTSP